MVGGRFKRRICCIINNKLKIFIIIIIFFCLYYKFNAIIYFFFNQRYQSRVGYFSFGQNYLKHENDATCLFNYEIGNFNSGHNRDEKIKKRNK